MVLTWIGDVRPLLDERCYFKYWEKLPDFRRKKADKYRVPMGRALSVGAWSLWQQAMEEFNLPDDAPFNLSHSGCYAMCCAETNPDASSEAFLPIQVGCDIEQISRYRENISRRFFCPEEYLHIKSHENPEAKKELFFRYWVLKESFIKATRKGMAMALDSFSFEIKNGANPVLNVCPAPYKKEAYHFREFELGEYRAAVCSTDPDISTKIRWTSFS